MSVDYNLLEDYDLLMYYVGYVVAVDGGDGDSGTAVVGVDYNEDVVLAAVGRNVAVAGDELATRPGGLKLRLRYPH